MKKQLPKKQQRCGTAVPFWTPLDLIWLHSALCFQMSGSNVVVDCSIFGLPFLILFTVFVLWFFMCSYALTICATCNLQTSSHKTRSGCTQDCGVQLLLEVIARQYLIQHDNQCPKYWQPCVFPLNMSMIHKLFFKLIKTSRPNMFPHFTGI